jgi:hypothetical protein
MAVRLATIGGLTALMLMLMSMCRKGVRTETSSAASEWVWSGTEGPLPMIQFRPDVVVSGGARPGPRASGVGRRIRIGGAVFHGAGECGR